MLKMSGNIFLNLPLSTVQENFETLIETGVVTIERIVSHGQASPETGWYDQDRHEWVMIVKGEAGLQFEGEQEERIIQQGDYLMIPAHCRHRVAWTDPYNETVWLAIHF